MKKFSGILLVMLALCLPTFGTHILGGELTYKFIGSDGPVDRPFRYLIHFVGYVDRVGTPGQASNWGCGNLSANPVLFVFDASNQGPFYYPGFDVASLSQGNSSSSGASGSRIADAISASLSMPLPDQARSPMNHPPSSSALKSTSPLSSTAPTTPSSTNSLSRQGSGLGKESHPGETLLQHWHAEDEDFSALHSKHIPEIATLFQRSESAAELGESENGAGRGRRNRRQRMDEMREQARLRGQLNKEMKCGLEKGCFGPSFF
jgi:hypothetical protein